MKPASFDAMTDYLGRGQAFGLLSDDALIHQWCTAHRACAEGGDGTADWAVREADLKCEIALREIDLPFDEIEFTLLRLYTVADDVLHGLARPAPREWAARGFNS